MNIQLPDGLRVAEEPEGLTLTNGELSVRGDFTRLKRRIREENLSRELIVRAAKFRDKNIPLTAFDATAGLGEDSFLLAAAGYDVVLYEYNQVIYALLEDCIKRAAADPDLKGAAERMHLICGDSIAAMDKGIHDVSLIILDPMFPERRKSALVKKKFQLLQMLETPCADETKLLSSALAAGARRVIVKRPAKGLPLAGKTPSWTISGSGIRYDCYPVSNMNEES